MCASLAFHCKAGEANDLHSHMLPASQRKGEKLTSQVRCSHLIKTDLRDARTNKRSSSKGHADAPTWVPITWWGCNNHTVPHMTAGSAAPYRQPTKPAAAMLSCSGCAKCTALCNIAHCPVRHDKQCRHCEYTQGTLVMSQAHSSIATHAGNQGILRLKRNG